MAKKSLVNASMDLSLKELKALGHDKLTEIKAETETALTKKISKDKKEDYTMFLETIVSVLEEIGQAEKAQAEKKVASTKAPKAPQKPSSKPQEQDKPQEAPKAPKQEAQDKPQTEKKAQGSKSVKTGDKLTLTNEEYESHYVIVNATKWNVVIRCTDTGNESNVMLLEPNHFKQGYIEFAKEGKLNIVLA